MAKKVKQNPNKIKVELDRDVHKELSILKVKQSARSLSIVIRGLLRGKK